MNVSGPSRGYILEVFNGHFHLPNLGAIGEEVAGLGQFGGLGGQ